MICVLFAKMDQVFSLKLFFKKNWKSQEFCQSGKAGTMMDQVNEKDSRWMTIITTDEELIQLWCICTCYILTNIYRPQQSCEG